MLAIRCHARFTGFRYVALDVTKDASVQAAFDFISKDLETTCTGVNKLVGVINCAGIAVTGPIEYLPVAMYQRQFDVNFFGYVWQLQHGCGSFSRLSQLCTAPHALCDMCYLRAHAHRVLTCACNPMS